MTGQLNDRRRRIGGDAASSGTRMNDQRTGANDEQIAFSAGNFSSGVLWVKGIP